MRRLEKIVLASAALITLGAGLVYGCKKDYPITPTQPTPIVTPAPTQEPTYTLTPEPTPTLKPYTPTPKPIEVPTPTITPTPITNNSYDFAKSLGLEADYLKNVAFDSNSKGLISYLASLPMQMRTIAERSGLVDKLIADKQVNADEQAYFGKIIGSYQKDIDMMKPWLTGQLPDDQVNAALALNLTNAIKYNQLVSLPNALFTADGIERKYVSEIKAGDKWGRGVLPYTSAMVENVSNFDRIRAKALEVANNPKYDEFATNPLAKEYFRIEAVGSTDAGVNAYEDIKLLAQNGSPAAKAALRIYDWNLGEGKKGSAGQVRCELTEIDLWSIGIPSYTVVLAGHDVPTIPLTLDDIALLKSRSADPLLIVDIDSSYHLPLQWTRKSTVKKEWENFTLSYGTGAKKLKVSELKPY